MTWCNYCGKTYTSERGLKMHYGHCSKRNAKLRELEQKEKVPERPKQTPVINTTNAKDIVVINSDSLNVFYQAATRGIFDNFETCFRNFASSCIPTVLELKKAGFTGESIRRELLKSAKLHPCVQTRRIAEALEKSDAEPIVGGFAKYAIIDMIVHFVCNELTSLNEFIYSEIEK